MKLDVTDEAANWYKEEMDITEAAYMRFFVRYGGVGGKIPGFSLGIKMEEPEKIHASQEHGNVTFFIEESDEWYFEDDSLKVELDETRDEPIFSYV